MAKCTKASPTEMAILGLLDLVDEACCCLSPPTWPVMVSGGGGALAGGNSSVCMLLSAKGLVCSGTKIVFGFGYISGAAFYFFLDASCSHTIAAQCDTSLVCLKKTCIVHDGAEAFASYKQHNQEGLVQWTVAQLLWTLLTWS